MIDYLSSGFKELQKDIHAKHAQSTQTCFLNIFAMVERGPSTCEQFSDSAEARWAGI